MFARLDRVVLRGDVDPGLRHLLGKRGTIAGAFDDRVIIRFDDDRDSFRIFDASQVESLGVVDRLAELGA